jgi:hypothetical protein
MHYFVEGGKCLLCWSGTDRETRGLWATGNLEMDVMFGELLQAHIAVQIQKKKCRAAL